MTHEAKLPITVLVQTKNEELGIEACLRSLSDFDQVIVVDSHSTDRTQDLARACGAEVVSFAWNNRYPKKKQWQLDNLETRHPWVLFLDADESPRPALIKELRERFSKPIDEVAFDVRLDYVFAGRLLRHGHRVFKRCLVLRDKVNFPVVDDLDLPGMGELEGHYQPHAAGPVGKLRGRILHNDLDPVSTWFTRHNRYSDWEAALSLRSQSRGDVRASRSRQGRLFDAVPFKPAVFFLYSYFLRAGLLDGRAGLDYAVALSTYYWQIGLKRRELRERQDRATSDGASLSRHRVLQVINTLEASDGGPARNAFEVNQALNAAGPRAQLIYMRGAHEFSTPFIDERAGRVLVGPRPRGIRDFGRGPISQFFAFARLARGVDVVVIHGYYLWWAPAVALVAAAVHARVVVMPHGALSLYESVKSRRRKRVFEIISRLLLDGHVSAFVVGSAREANDVLEVRPGAHVVEVGVGTRLRGLLEHLPVDDHHRQLGLLSISRIAAKKRIDLMIDAVAVLRERGIACRLTVAGAGDEELATQLLTRAVERNVSELVAFVGHVGPEEKSRLFAESDVFLLPSEDENFGIGLAEALAHGVPCVASDRVAAADGLNGRGVSIVQDPDGPKLADAIEPLRSIDKWMAASQAAKRSAAESFSWDAVASRWQEVFDEVGRA